MFFIFVNDTATTEIYTLSLHDALPIYCGAVGAWRQRRGGRGDRRTRAARVPRRGGRARASKRAGAHALGRVRDGHADRKSTRLNSSHANISYAVFCLKKKKSQSLTFPT